MFDFKQKKEQNVLNSIEKVKVLQLTDVHFNYNNEFESEQLEILRKGDIAVYADDLLSDNGNDPDGDMWAVLDFEDNPNLYKAIEKGAKIITMYKADYDGEYVDYIEKFAENWIGIQASYVAYFLNKEHAVLCQKIYNKIREIESYTFNKTNAEIEDIIIRNIKQLINS